MTRRAKLSRLAVPIVLAVAMGGAVVLPAGAVTSVKKFSEGLHVGTGGSVTNATLDPGSTNTLQFDITNAHASNQAFGSALILVPNGFTAGVPSLTPASHVLYPNFQVNWSSAAHTGFLLTSTGPTGSGIPHDGTISITSSVTAPTTGVCNAVWTTQVKQSNDFSGSGNDFVATNTVTTSVGSNHLAFTTQPVDTEFDKTMANVVVTAEDPCNQAVGSFNGTVTLTDLFDPTKVASGSTATAASGVATFSNITFVSDWGYTDSFTATATGFDSATSNAFSVEQVIKTCDANKTCSASGLNNSGTLNTIAGIDVGSAPSQDTLKVSVAGKPDPAVQDYVQTCQNTQITATGTTPTFYGTIVSLQINNRQKTVTMTLPKSYVLLQPTPNGTPFWDICLQTDAQHPFTDKFGNAGVTAGFLPDCPTTLPSPLVQPCIQSRNKNAGNEIIRFVLPPGDPHAVWG